RTIGNPLFFPREDRLGIENNRIVAHHIGAKGQLRSSTSYRTLLTYSRNYGTYGNVENPRDETYPYYRGKKQFSFLLETQSLLPFLNGLHLNAGIALDIGELYSGNIGFMLGISRRFQK